MTLLHLLRIAVGASALGAQEPPHAEPPRLVVLISVDQMRYDYLTRFGDTFSGGLARLLQGGLVFTNAHVDHALAGTAPGHATLVTGVSPARHGIPANRFLDRELRRFVYAVDDPESPLVGVVGGGRSPVQLLHPAVGDWLKEASAQSKVFAAATKDRVAVLMGGRRADAAYWYHEDSGRYVTSRYYRPELPAWLETFNATDPMSAYMAAGWSKLLDDAAYARSREDSFPPETGGKHFLFPHPIGDNGLPPHQSITYTPFADAVTLQLIRHLVTEEELGGDERPDLLAIGLAGGDAIGHEFGPMSQEVQDYYLRLDLELGAFLEFLDRQVGADRYVVLLTADHGTPLLPEESQRRGVEAGRVTLADLQPMLVPVLQEALFDLEIEAIPQISFVFPYGFSMLFPDSAVTERQLRELRARVAAAVRKAPGVADAFTFEELANRTTKARPFLAEYRASFVPNRAPDVMVHFKRNYFFTTTLPVDHGTPYDYDTHVPIMLFGAGVAPGRKDQRVSVTDVAPTLAALLGVTPSPDVEGQSLLGRRE